MFKVVCCRIVVWGKGLIKFLQCLCYVITTIMPSLWSSYYVLIPRHPHYVMFLTKFTIYWGIRRFQQFFSHITAASSPSHVFPHNKLPKQLAAFPHRLCAHWWKTMTLVTLTFIKCQKESWPSWDSNSQPLDWQPTSLPRLKVQPCPPSPYIY